MDTMASQITSLTIVYSTVYSGADQRNVETQRHWPLWGVFTGDRWIPHTKGKRKMFPFDDVIMKITLPSSTLCTEKVTIILKHQKVE